MLVVYLIHVSRLFQVYFYKIKLCAHFSTFVYLYIVISGQTAGSKCLKFLKINFNIFFFQKSKFFISIFKNSMGNVGHFSYYIIRCFTFVEKFVSRDKSWLSLWRKLDPGIQLVGWFSGQIFKIFKLLNNKFKTSKYLQFYNF